MRAMTDDIRTDDIKTDETKKAIYHEALRELDAVLEGVDDPITAMATCSSVLHQRLPYASWTGFYRVVAPRLLRVGPYQGPLGCLEIPFDRGVCGAAARERTAQVVPDVHAFPGHIACDAAARSEIVIPIYDARGDLVAVLDIDSHQPGSFDDDDRLGLERIAERLRSCLGNGAAFYKEPAPGA
jgi:GAF domain-containing protein